MKKIDYKWFALALLWVAFFLQQGTRQIYGPLLGSIQTSVGATDVQLGLVSTVFTLVYGLSIPFAGFAADLFSRKWMVAIGVAIFSAGILTSGFVTCIGALVVTYGLVNGFGQPFYYPSSTSLISQLHADSKATALSLLQLGMYGGVIGCSWLAGWFAGLGAEEWRLPFKVLGVLGILWAVVLAFTLRNTQIETSNSQTFKPSNSQTFKPSNPQTFKPSTFALLTCLSRWKMLQFSRLRERTKKRIACNFHNKPAGRVKFKLEKFLKFFNGRLEFSAPRGLL